jgi:hypothetical protein
MTGSLQRFWRIQVFVPVDEPSSGGALALDIRANRHVRAVVGALASTPGVGQVGNYDNVCELVLGWEGYRANPGASPRVGAIGERVVLPTVAVTSFLDFDHGGDGALGRIVEAVKAVHPWEHPIIQFSECLLYVPLGE